MFVEYSKNTFIFNDKGIFGYYYGTPTDDDTAYYSSPRAISDYIAQLQEALDDSKRADAGAAEV